MIIKDSVLGNFIALLATWLIALPAFASEDSSKVVDLILVAGQSNAVGFDAPASDLPSNPIDEQVLFWWKCGDPPPDRHDSSSGGWTTLRPQGKGDPKPKDLAARQYGNFAQEAGGFGPEISLARQLLKKQPDTGLAVLKVAFSGTGIRRDWNPADRTGKSGACFRALVEEFKTATEVAKKRGIRLRPRAMIWVQGESDANAGDHLHYADALTGLIAAVRRNLESPDLKVLTAFNTSFGGGENAFIGKIVDAQKAVSAADTNVEYVDTSKATTANRFHYDAKGTLDVGRWFADALIELESQR